MGGFSKPYFFRKCIVTAKFGKIESLMDNKCEENYCFILGNTRVNPPFTILMHSRNNIDKL